MGRLEAALCELWQPVIERLEAEAMRAGGIAVIHAGVVDGMEPLFSLGICCESARVADSAVTFSLCIACVRGNAGDPGTVRGTVGWFRTMSDYGDDRHPGYAIWLRETPCFSLEDPEAPARMERWLPRLEREMRRCIRKGVPPGELEVALRRLLRMSRGRQEMPLMSEMKRAARGGEG
ncbi:hypothetical protein OKA05_27370 [Luteolibacter arcticus]|uniref:AraC family transcriptional regulator n=1 Tax=Luteolibacter arcticus TaxID=1581411 RepID=A0ABT3GS08_9BACT|nr:hypothetical protein [Luteolibacter arcticus]MCW1926305.1 hypothetical protein [Luteolibacter arcticus]